MMQRADAGIEPAMSDGIAWRIAMTVLWPLRMLLRGAAGRSSGSSTTPSRRFSARQPWPLSGRPARSRCCRARPASGVGVGILYALLGRSCSPSSCCPSTSSSSPPLRARSRSSRSRTCSGPTPWTLDHFRYLFTQMPFVQLVHEHPDRGRWPAPSSRCSRRAWAAYAPGAAEVAWRGRHGHHRADRLPDAAVADVHPAVLHPGAACGSRTPCWR